MAFLGPARSTSHGGYPLPNLKRSLVTISMRKISPGSKWQERHPRDTRRLLFYVFVFVGFLFAFCLSMGDSLSNGIVILCFLVLVASFFSPWPWGILFEELPQRDPINPPFFGKPSRIGVFYRCRCILKELEKPARSTVGLKKPDSSLLGKDPGRRPIT